jgi:NADH-quinone oxidoreductase subunit C
MDSPVRDHIKQTIQSKFGNALLQDEMLYDFYTLTLRKEYVLPVIRLLYDDDRFRFRFLTTLCGLHYPQQEEELGVMYQLHSLENNYRIRLKTFFSTEEAELPSLTGIFSCANWMERETYDFFGIRFTGHPDLRRILNVDDMIIYPMRKEYPLEDQTRIDKHDAMFGR